MIELLSKALWITLISYIVFISARWFYKRFLKEKSVFYFYFLSLKKDDKNANDWYLRLESPLDDFLIKLEVQCDSEIVYTKNAHLKEGINRILLSSKKFNPSCKLKIKSDSQIIERSFEEAEV